MLIGEVAQPVPLRKTFDYEIREPLRAAARPGVRVRAPFGPRRLTGVLMSVREGTPTRPLKPIDAVLDPEPLLTEDQLDLARWLAKRYCAPLGDCLKSMLPVFVKEDPSGRTPGASISTYQPAGLAAPAPAGFELTPGQAAAVDALLAKLRTRSFGAALLFGVPASGKTEVYLRLMREVISAGGQALYLLPEISLTRPFFDELSRRAGFSVALWHSQMGVRDRRAIWLGLRRGNVQAVVGARSASLLPFKDLRLTIVDEEQDESYKQEGQAPLYHARDIALERARRSLSLVIFGSATPSMEAMASVESGDWALHAMPDRVAHTSRPTVEIVSKPPRYGSCLTDELLQRIKDRLERREQVILLVNRRGFSNFVMCRKCRWIARCKTCGVAFIHHQAQDGGSALFVLLCHHCGRKTEVPKACPQCKDEILTFAGIGTQKVVAELKRLVPEAKVLRMDSDTVSKEKAKDEKIYEQFRDRKADILVGTKLVAKGFHFPDVTLVGVVDADTMLHMPDFRAAERTVQLLVQAAGRSGRAEKPGEVLVQTEQPEHYAIQAVARGDFGRYAAQELEYRRELDYPPKAGLVRLILSGKTEEGVVAASQAYAEALAPKLEGIPCDILGPSPAIHSRLRGRWRYHFLVKVRDPKRTDEALERAASIETPSGIKLSVNVDPYDLF
ncbi:MAG: primosomal protein N' [Elusimicrobia bacterium]|nr:primosomal protein N' [Elusimicrobiota bacterium]